MLEWNTVTPVNFTKANGDTVQVKLRYELKPSDSNLFVDCQGQDIDALAHKYLGTEAESLNILQNNAVAISENKFDMSKVKRIKIPTQ